MSGPATNAATIGMVWKMMGPRTTAAYLASVAITSLACGLALDYLFIVTGIRAVEQHQHHGASSMLKTASAVLLLLMFVASAWRTRHKPPSRAP
jgi:hypothetical protein